jgi:hypothetical protein
MNATRARVAAGVSFAVICILGGALIYATWMQTSVTVAITRAILFVVIMGCVSTAGCLLYEKQHERDAVELPMETPHLRLSPLYRPAIRFGLLTQAILGLFTALLLDYGEVFNVFKIAFLAHWLGIALIIWRRPVSPTKSDIVFIRWGTPLLMFTIGPILNWYGRPSAKAT